MARSRGVRVTGVLLGTVAGLVLAYLLATGTEWGRNWLLSALLDRTAGLFGGRGRITVGLLTQISPGHIVAEDVRLVDTAGVAVVQAQHLEGTLSVRGLFTKAIHIGTLSLRGVTMNFRQDFAGPFNIANIISGPPKTGPRGKPGFGDDIRIDKLELSDGTMTLVSPWSPHPVFTGTARDSVIAVRDSLHDIERTPRGILQRRVVQLDRVVAHDVIVTEPGRGPGSMLVDTLRGKISDPPVVVTAASGRLRWTGDSLRFELPSLALPASTGSAAGLVSWNQPGPVHYDVLIDTKAGLSDLGWIWDVLPDSGGGNARVRMRTLADANDAEYTLSGLDVRTMASRVTGDITVITRPTALELRGVNLEFAPIGSDLLRRLSYESLPADIDGVFTGRLVAAEGGPLTAFRVDRLDARFVDANAGGAVSGARLTGTVSLGAAPSAFNARLDNVSVDLRTARALLPASTVVPDGMVTGSARISAADLESADLKAIALKWTDAAGNVSEVRGDARVRFGDRDPSVTLDVILDPLSMRALARIDTTIPLRSTLAGRFKARGTLSALSWDASLAANSASGIALSGTASIRLPDWRVRATGSVNDFDMRTWFGGDNLPVTALGGSVDFDLSGTTPEVGPTRIAAARATVALRQTAAPELPAFGLIASGALDETRLIIDSATATLGGVTFDARGALARDSTRTDTLNVSARADSLDAVRPELRRLAAMLMPVDTAVAKSFRTIASDTLLGDFSVAGPLFGSLDDFDATLTIGARNVQVGAIKVGLIFGSARATDVLQRPFFEGAATADEVSGVGAIRVSTAEFRLQQASPDSGRLILDVTAEDTSHLVVRGGYARAGERLTMLADSLTFQSGGATWRNVAPIRVVSDATSLQIDSLEIRSSRRGSLAMAAVLPTDGPVSGTLRLDQFPVGTAAAFTLGTPLFAGSLSGDVGLTGTRLSPLLAWRLRADSLGMEGTYFPLITSDGSYANRLALVRAVLADSAGGAVRAEARVPLDLSLQAVEKRLLSDAVDAEIIADSLRLHALGFTVAGVSRARGTLAGRLALTGTMERPVATGTMTLDGLAARFDELNIEPSDGRLVVRAAQDSLILESFRIRSGGARDTLGATGAMRFALGQPATIQLNVSANNLAASRQRDGTDIDVSGNVELVGPLRRPVLRGSVFIPTANIVIDPLGTRTALDLSSSAAQELLGVEEIPVAATATKSFARFGRFVTVENARIDLGNTVWVRTPEANVKVSGGLALRSTGDELALEGEISADRGQYRLDLGLVNRSFTIDSGRVRFYGIPAIEPTVDITATNVVRVASGEAIPIRVQIAGSYPGVALTLSSNSPLLSSAPESEIISYLIFGAPTFALNAQSQRNVQALTGVLVPTAGGLVEGKLQQLLPVFNTIEVSTAGGQRDSLSAFSFLDNLSITAGKQLGDRAFLRFNTGVCRGSSQASGRATSPYFGIAAEYRLGSGYSAQVGVDPGAAPCSQLGTERTNRWQFGFDLFREWIF